MTDMEPRPIDLSQLALPDLRRERMVRAVLARAQTAAARGPLGVLAGWARPTLAAAAVVASVSLGALAWPAARPESAQPLTVADGLRIPQPAADWIVEDRAPTEDDLLVSWEQP